MRNKLLFNVVFLFLLSTAIANALTDAQVQNIADQSLVYIQGRNENMYVSGSGFFIASDLVATNYHVIRDMVEVSGIDHSTGSTFHFEGAIDIDAVTDLAVLKVRGNFRGTPISVYSGSISKGQRVYSAGFPGGNYAFKKGKVVDPVGPQDCESYNFKISRDMIRMGNSGGPILGTNASVIGVAVAGLAFHLPFPFIRLKIHWENYAIYISYLQRLYTNAHSGVNYNFPISVGWESACALSRTADTLLAHGHYNSALSTYNRVLSKDSSVAMAYIGRAVAKYQLGWGSTSVIEDLSTALHLLPAGQLAQAIRQIIEDL